MKKYMIIACTIFLYICLLVGQASTYDVIGNAEITRKILPSRNLVETTDSWRQYWDQNNKVPFTFMDKAHKAEQDVQVKSQIIQAKKQAIMIGQKKYIFNIKDIKIVRVIPRKGNNPVNQQDPINNVTRNGQVIVGQAADEVGESSGSSSSSQQTCFNCSPSEIVVSSTAVGSFDSADFFFDPNTPACAVSHASSVPGMDNPFFVYPYYPYSSGDTFTIGPGADSDKYQISPPLPTDGIGDIPKIITITHKDTGKSWDVKIILTNFNNADQSYTFRVIQVIPR